MADTCTTSELTGVTNDRALFVGCTAVDRNTDRRMRVDAVDFRDGWAECVWRDNNGAHRRRFPLSDLSLARENSPVQEKPVTASYGFFGVGEWVATLGQIRETAWKCIDGADYTQSVNAASTAKAEQHLCHCDYDTVIAIRGCQCGGR